MYETSFGISNNSVLFSLSLYKPTAEGYNLAGVTDSGYELRSRGPASRGFGVLDRKSGGNQGKITAEQGERAP